MLQKLIYSINAFLSSNFYNLYVLNFKYYFWTNMLWYYGSPSEHNHSTPWRDLKLKHSMHPCQEEQMRGSLFPSSLATSQLLRHATWTPQLCSWIWGIVIQFFFTFTPWHEKQMGTPHLYFASTAIRYVGCQLRATSHTRPSARDHYTSSTLIGGICGATPSMPHSRYARGDLSISPLRA
jgi:hypothetical protein